MATTIPDELVQPGGRMVLVVLDGVGGLPAPDTGLTELEAARLAHKTSAEADLPEGVEPVFSEDGEVSPLAIVEDELILALPVVAVHEACSAPVEAKPAATGPSNPFAVLKELKDRQR
jgi:uncharacterized metal-binding protein YceD (DUF177 family)